MITSSPQETEEFRDMGRAPAESPPVCDQAIANYRGGYGGGELCICENLAQAIANYRGGYGAGPGGIAPASHLSLRKISINWWNWLET